MATIMAEEIGHFLGGTITKVLTEDGRIFYVDHRLKSKTRGKVFNNHPDLKSARVVDVKLDIEKTKKF